MKSLHKIRAQEEGINILLLSTIWAHKGGSLEYSLIDDTKCRMGIYTCREVQSHYADYIEAGKPEVNLDGILIVM